MRVFVRLFLFVVCSLTLVMAGCGGGGGGDSDTTTSTPPAATAPTCPAGSVYNPSTGVCEAVPVATVGSYVGKWAGSYTITGQSSVPVSLHLIGSNAAITGNIYSAFIAGPVSGAVAADGSLALTISNQVDSTAWGMVLVQTGTGVAISTITSGASGSSSVGSGSCVPQVAADFDLSGQYAVKFRKTYPGTPGAYLDATMVLAKLDDATYIGVIFANDGLQSRIKLFSSAGWWLLQIPVDGGSLGSNITAKNGLLSQSPPITTAAMISAATDGVVSPVLAPLGFTMNGVYDYTTGGNTYELTTTYDFLIYLEGSPVAE